MNPLNCHTSRSLLAAAALAVVGALPAQAEIVDIVFGDDQRFARDLEVPAGKFAEACGRLPRGSTVQWQFTGGEPLDFNIHFHEGRKVVYPVKQDKTAGEQGSLSVSADQPYCWMWTNKSPRSVTVGLQLSR